MRWEDLVGYSWVATYFASRVRGAWYRLRYAFDPRVCIGPGLRAEGPLCIAGSGRVQIGRNVLLRRSNTCAVVIRTLSPEAVVTIKDGAQLGGTQILCCNQVSIGEGTFTANCRVQDIDFAAAELDQQPGTVRIGKGVWVGLSSVLLKNTDIGDSSIVSAGSVVDRPIGSLIVAMGNVARPIQGIIPPAPPSRG